MALAVRFVFDRSLFVPAVTGIAAAWAASSISVAALVLTRSVSQRAYWWAFGGGFALRGAVFIALVAFAWDAERRIQAGTWIAYALGVLVLLQLEYRHLTGD